MLRLYIININLLYMLLQFIKRTNIKLLCIDFDKTLVSVQTHGKWNKTAEELAIYVRPEFKKLIKYAFQNGIYVSIVTFSPQIDLVKKCLEINFPNLYKNIIIRGTNQKYNINSDLLKSLGITNEARKNKMIASVILEIQKKYNINIKLNNIILIDDDYSNICAARSHFGTFFYNKRYMYNIQENFNNNEIKYKNDLLIIFTILSISLVIYSKL